MADYSNYAIPSEEWARFLNSGRLRSPPITMNQDERRLYLNETRARQHREFFGPVPDNIMVSELLIPTSDSSVVQARLYRPKNAPLECTSSLPVIIHLHSGGWHLGSLETEEPFCAYLCKALSDRAPPGYSVVNLCYRHSPEYLFPAQLNDVCAALEYIVGSTSEKQKLGTGPARIILSGTSAGAHLAIGCAIRESQRTEINDISAVNIKRRIDKLILSCPPTVDVNLFPFHLLRSQDIASYVQNHDDAMLGLDRARFFWDMYLGRTGSGDDEKRHFVGSEAVLSPLLAADSNFEPTSWPPTSFHVAGMDCLRDEALLFEEKLRHAKVATRLQVYSGMPHAFNVLPQLEASRKWRENIIEDIAMWQDES